MTATTREQQLRDDIEKLRRTADAMRATGNEEGAEKVLETIGRLERIVGRLAPPPT
jgi:hypothetical protein